MNKENSTINKKLLFYKYKIIQNKKNIDLKMELIDKYAYIYKLDRRELYGILVIEYVNRGNWLIKSIERVALNFFTKIAVKLDLSIGLAQIKISTAKKLYPNSDIKLIAKKLLSDDFNIHVCTQIINEYYNSTARKGNRKIGLVKKYTTGNEHSADNTAIIIYYLLLEWIINESLILK